MLKRPLTFALSTNFGTWRLKLNLKILSASIFIPDTGGLRKIRWKNANKGKRGGARIIYYFYDEKHPIYLLFAYTKNVQVDLTEQEKKAMRTLVQQLKKSFLKEV